MQAPITPRDPRRPRRGPLPASRCLKCQITNAASSLTAPWCAKMRRRVLLAVMLGATGTGFGQHSYGMSSGRPSRLIRKSSHDI